MAMQQELAPGQIVRYPAEPDWGVGQVQSPDTIGGGCARDG